MTGSPQPVGGVLKGVSTISTAGGAFLAGTCHRGTGDVMVIPSGGSAWLPVPGADGCRATLSPDGGTVAFTEDGHTVRTVPAAGGPETRPSTPPRRPGWRRQGSGRRDHRAVLGERRPGRGPAPGALFGVVVHTPKGDHLGVISGSPNFVGALAWQPSGSLVAMATFVQGQGSVLRVMDARTGAVRVLATDPRGLSGTVWAPNGSLVASLDSRGTWEFVDGNGNRAGLVPVDNEIPLDWAG